LHRSNADVFGAREGKRDGRIACSRLQCAHTLFNVIQDIRQHLGRDRLTCQAPVGQRVELRIVI
jgi:hypothetical protein